MITSITLDKTWTFTEFASPTTYPISLYTLKTALLATTYWTVISSSGKVGGVTWTVGAADYWDSSAAVVNAVSGSNHSWIVLQNNNISAGFQICFDYNHGTGYYGSMTVSPSSGFTGGTTTNRATAVDELVVSSLAVFSSAYAFMLATSSDGKCTRVFWQLNGQNVSFWSFEVPKDPPSWFTTPFVACCANVEPTYATLSSSSTGYFKSVVGGSATTFSLLALGVHTYSYFDNSNIPVGCSAPYSGDWFIHPCMLASITAGRSGLCGYLYDAYWGSTKDGSYNGLLQKSPKYLDTVGLNSGLMSIGYIFFGNDGNKHGRLL